ncbi:hypothetical protein GCM10007423_26900 [Dyadobacter endophyticus]|uniref:Uncharacterized protein n=1 Tax=Dyadobacter endophyticus TaxID=1749036 RepID=A0ABQ1YQW4_9BACT|nr:hypothetical protein GCM10007423_26900 [Dyadobacter endophyticus]
MREKWKAFVVLLMSASKIIFDSDDILNVISVDSHGNQLNIHVQGKQKTGRVNHFKLQFNPYGSNIM